MKIAKKRHNLAELRSRLNLSFIQHSQAPTPREAEFRYWLWHAIKPFYRQAEIALILADKTEARQYNHQYRDKDYATNILSFALDEGENWLPESATPILRGDLIICPEVVTQEAQEQGKSLTAHYAHLTLHGALHLMGYDHIEENDAQVMETLEIQLLNQLGYANPYLET